MKEKIMKLEDELKYILDNEFTLLDYLEEMRTSKYTGVEKKHEVKEMLDYLYSIKGGE